MQQAATLRLEYRLATRVDAELAVNIFHVRLYGADRDTQCECDFGITVPTRNQFKNGIFPARQRLADICIVRVIDAGAGFAHARE